MLLNPVDILRQSTSESASLTSDRCMNVLRRKENKLMQMNAGEIPSQSVIRAHLALKGSYPQGGKLAMKQFYQYSVSIQYRPSIKPFALMPSWFFHYPGPFNPS